MLELKRFELEVKRFKLEANRFMFEPKRFTLASFYPPRGVVRGVGDFKKVERFFANYT